MEEEVLVYLCSLVKVCFNLLVVEVDILELDFGFEGDDILDGGFIFLFCFVVFFLLKFVFEEYG